jgi:transcriptional regulator with XRE-family HTH domain
MAHLPTIGDRVRFALEARGMKQTEIAERIGVTQAAISNIVTDSSRKPSAPTLLKLASALQANPYWIISGEGAPFEITTVGRDDERKLIELYRELPPAKKPELLKIARTMAERISKVTR